ncbi:MAG TPA: cyclopropane-fatty-acyl-phospholipid synthase family protein [Solirubrobacteraceae bacterium]|nr:cyclopropane-fatty-acyl-phospholipid synthase family protein [Solirubrobacteraceae bacterium]
MFRHAIHRLLSHVRDGRVVLVEGGRRTTLGTGDDLTAEVRVHDPRAYRATALRTSIGLADSYVDGRWDCDDLVALIRIAARNMGGLDRVKRRLAFATRPWQRLAAALRPATLRRARADVQAHYDLSNELYELFLDETLTYSCAVFERPGMTLREAQEAKLERICRKLGLGPGDHVLEIGSGWGGFAIYAAGTRGCRVTTTTISDAQREEALRRVREAGLEDLVEVLGVDYRELRGRWSRLVSVEMIEAVGWRQLGTYLRHCGRLLADDGLFCLQAITMDERAYETEKGTRTFANTRIFPGGFLPSVGAIVRETARRSPLRPIHLEEIGAHYAETLRIWRERFEAVDPRRLLEIGFDERFRRLWRFYLAYMEAGFRERRIGDVQLVLAGSAFRDEAGLLARVSPLGEPVGA